MTRRNSDATTRRGSPRRNSDRAQTLPDFALGITIFLVTLAFLVVFVPQLTAPYGDTEQPVVADRAASTVGQTLLADGRSPSMLNESCTAAFFEQDDGSGCAFDTTESVPSQLGIGSSYSVNVTLRDEPSDVTDSTILCEDWPGDCGTNADSLAVGPSTPDDDRSVAVARRTVYLDNSSAVLEVVVWQ